MIELKQFVKRDMEMIIYDEWKWTGCLSTVVQSFLIVLIARWYARFNTTVLSLSPPRET